MESLSFGHLGIVLMYHTMIWESCNSKAFQIFVWHDELSSILDNLSDLHVKMWKRLKVKLH